ncbi:MAG: SbcC/MukB-like Walker B domain-containing protein [Candidatus Onthovivens sp.]|nr:SbcC/MukB-like Walker B domain-containing protein [Candidatus Onthovivens sp.]
MKSLTKAKIINWHYFWNQTIDFKDIVFLTGKNASGKSTLIDALELVLLGDTSGKYFNKAAMDKSARTLKGYLRGEIGDTLEGDFKYLRSGRFTSYIVLEFFDDLHNEYFTMGIVFDSFADGSEEHHFFEFDDRIPENEFIENKYPMEYKALYRFLNENYNGRFKFFDTNKQYTEFLKFKFGGLKDKYFSLLKKAASFTPITDITTFITEHVCEKQENIELSSLQENILQYKKLQVEAERLEHRVTLLQEIDDNFNKYVNARESLDISKYLIEKCELEMSKDKVNGFKNNVIKAQERIAEIDLELEENKNNLQILENRKINLLADKTNNDVGRLVNELMEQKRQIETQINDIEAKKQGIKDNLNAYCDKYINASTKLVSSLKTFNKDFLDEDRLNDLTALEESAKVILDNSKEFKELLKGEVTSITEDRLVDFRTKLSNFKNNVSTLAISIARNISNIEKKIAKLREEEKTIKTGTKSYSEILMTIRKKLEEDLKEKFHKDIPVSIYADLIDIKDLSWSNAIEGFLAGQKFNLFVAPKYYIEAYKSLAKLVDLYRYYSISIVDEEKIIERNYRCEPESLAEEIITDHEGARAYTNFLIGRLHKSMSVNEARESGNGITKECDLYRNFALSKINPRLYQSSYIGRSLDERFIKEKNIELQNNLANLGSFRSLSSLITEANNLEILNSNEISIILEDILKTSGLEGLQKTLDYIKEELSERDTTLISSIDKRLKDVEADIEDLKQGNETLILEKGNLTNEIENLKKDKIKTEEFKIHEKEKSLINNYDVEFVNEKCLPYLENEFKEGKNFLTILNEQNTSIVRSQYIASNIFSQLVKARRDYCRDYHLSYDAEATDNNQFNAELADFRDVKLPEYKEKIKDSYDKATQQFKDDFIFKLRSAIEEAEDQIENLNQALKESSFGTDLYHFTVKPRTEYRRYYDMLKDDIILETDENESKFLEKYKDVMEDLFRQISDTGNNDTKVNVIKNIEDFTDYRSYLDFDLIVTNKITNEEQRLSKMIKKKSGGETQTPFYISVVASFAQLYHVHDEGEIANTIRLIIFDEAFSKMDRERIIEAVKLLRKFKLQVILSAPPEKIGDISSLVDETLLVSRDRNSSHVLLYSKVK